MPPKVREVSGNQHSSSRNYNPLQKKRVKSQLPGTAQQLQKKHTPPPLVIPSPPFSHSPSSHHHSLPTSPPPSPSPTVTHPQTQLTHYRGDVQLPCSGDQQLLLGDGRGSGIMARQQKELELMIQELQDRDEELNSLVEIQQKQASVWAEDRQKMLELEQRCTQLQALKQGTDEELARVKRSLKEMQCKERETAATTHALQACVSEAKGEKARLQERLGETERGLSELQQRLLSLQQEKEEMAATLKVVQKGTEERDRQLETLHIQKRSSEQELAKKEEDLLKLQQEKETLQTQLIASSVELVQLRTEVKMAGECDKRKGKLLQLQRSKLERHMREMDTLKKMCCHQDEQIASLKQQLHQNNIHTLSPYQPKSLATQVAEVDELTALLESAESCRGEDSAQDFKLTRSSERGDEAKLSTSSLAQSSATAALPGSHEMHQSSVNSQHLRQPVWSKTAVVSPQKLVQGDDKGGDTPVALVSELELSKKPHTYASGKHPHSKLAPSDREMGPREETSHLPLSPSPTSLPTLNHNTSDTLHGKRARTATPSKSRECTPKIRQKRWLCETTQSPPSVDLDHLAQEVRERISNIFIPTQPHIDC